MAPEPARHVEQVAALRAAGQPRRGERLRLGLPLALVCGVGAQVEVAEERVPGLGGARRGPVHALLLGRGDRVHGRQVDRQRRGALSRELSRARGAPRIAGLAGPDVAVNLPPVYSGSRDQEQRVDAPEPSPPETWDAFFSDFYLRAYADDERQGEAEVQALAAARLRGCPEGGDLLDVPCGFGRHAIPLARAGYRVVAVDRSPSLLAEARRRARRRALAQLVACGLPRAAVPRRALRRRRQPVHVAGLPRRRGGHPRPRRDRPRAAPGRRGSSIETMHRDRLVRGFHEQDWRLLGEGRLLLEQRTFDAPAGDGADDPDAHRPDGRARVAARTPCASTPPRSSLAMLERAGFVEARCHGDLDGGPFDGHPAGDRRDHPVTVNDFVSSRRSCCRRRRRSARARRRTSRGCRRSRSRCCRA